MMNMEKFDVVVVEDVRLELKGTLEILRTDIPEANVIGTASTEAEYYKLLEGGVVPRLLLLDLGLGGSTAVGVDICRQTRARFPELRILIFTGELLNEKVWVDALDAGANGVILKSGELLTRTDVMAVMEGRENVFNQPILEKITERFKREVRSESFKRDASITYDIDEYDERMLRHLALGYTKEMISSLKGMPFGVKSLEKRQNDLVTRLFPGDRSGVNATRLVVRALQLNIIELNNLEPDDE
jgi:DNA-binding NarL/FixJ family response regulator